ncbi:hypothetical protein NOCA2220106 [metagenome]|uniref:Uncharacterized protein n=1 Tax=metagenome TaxID=256318 RepID=A0A2P2BYU1_9ZZZZ
MTDLQPPSARDLDPEVRARLRTALLARADQPSATRGARGWLVPLASGAAVVAIVVAGAVGLSQRGDDAATPAQPLGSGTADDPTPGDPTADDTAVDSPTPSESESASPVDSPTPQAGAQACAREVRGPINGGPGVRGASELSSIPYDDGTTYLFGNDVSWVVCDDFATADGGPPTLIGNVRFDAAPSKSTFAISMNFVPGAGGELRSQYFAGGPLIEGVTSISYAFPGGGGQEAVMNDTMWAMVHLPRSGPMASGRIPSDPIVVTVTRDDGATNTFELEPPQDWCAQLNHGC